MATEDSRPPACERRRPLLDEGQVWRHNSWDNIEWDDAQQRQAQARLGEQHNESPHLANKDAVEEMVAGPAESRWDTFYQKHDRNFFKDRQWLARDFGSELFPAPCEGSATRRILEVGCGVGNTILPLARGQQDGNFFIHGCDLSQTAIDLLKGSPEYDARHMHIFHHDLSTEGGFEDGGIARGSLDVIVAIFVLSAIAPDRLPAVFAKLYDHLAPGGCLLFRDYAQYDMTQLRFKPAALVRDNLYVRGDGTAVHYFSREGLAALAATAGFEVAYNKVDSRLLVNRLRKVTMYRMWLQCKMKKPSP